MAVTSTQDFSAVYGRWMPSLTRYCRTILRSDADAEDAAQNAMLKAMDALATGPGPDELTPWLHRIARNEAISLMRRRRGDAELLELHHEHGPAPEEVIGTRDRLAQLVADVQALPERQRQALVLRELDGLPYRQIATVLHVTEGAAQQAVLDARRSMTECETGRALECESVQGWLNSHEHALVRGRKVRAHLRDCTGCRSFVAGLGTRPRELALLLPFGGTGAGILARIAALFGGGGIAATSKAILGAGLLATAGVGLGEMVAAPGSGDSAESSSRPAQLVRSRAAAPAMPGGARVVVPVSRAVGGPSTATRTGQRVNAIAVRTASGRRTSGPFQGSKVAGLTQGPGAAAPSQTTTAGPQPSGAPSPATSSGGSITTSTGKSSRVAAPSSPVASATVGTPAAQVPVKSAVAPVVTPAVEQVAQAVAPIVQVVTNTVSATTSTATPTTTAVTQTVSGVTGKLLGGG
jgi:RNA polymerase sigma factor (sigma-70 family)